jgi:hypothetical protein
MKFRNEAEIQNFWSQHPYRAAQLRSQCGKSITVLHPGFLNTGSGPDFFNACIRIDDVLWHGSVEIHSKSSEWFEHKHHVDPAYDNVVLHVVVQHDREVRKSNGDIPVVLKLPVVKQLRKRNRKTDIVGISPEDFAIRRLQRKSEELKLLPEAVRGDTHALFHRIFFAAFGNHHNALPFENLAVVTPPIVIQRQRHSLSEIEAVLFGQSGLLNEDCTDKYANDLRTRYQTLQSKFGLRAMSPVSWKQKGMRPVNFPCVRISQLAVLLHQNNQLMNEAIHSSSVSDLRQLLNVPSGEYWQTHFRFGQPSAPSVKRTGNSFINSILINVVALFRWYYGEMHVDTNLQKSAIELLSQLPAEENSIVLKSGHRCSNALQSQGILESLRANSY